MSNYSKHVLGGAFALAMLAVVAPAARAAESGLTVPQSWARPAAASQMGAIYVTVQDAGAPDRLVAARTPVAGDVELHETTKDGDVMKMRPVEGIAVAPGAPIKMAPGGYHIMLMGLKQPLKEGETIPATLVFEKAGEVQIQVPVRRAPPTP